MSTDDLQLTVGQYTLIVKASYLYTHDGLWIAWDAVRQRARVGFSDYHQQANGAVAYVEFPERGMDLAPGDELANLETAKVNLSVPAPFAATVLLLNEALTVKPELINRDPYGAGWLMDLRPATWPAPGLLEAPAYLATIASRAQRADQ